MKNTFTFERQLAKIIREKVISLTLLSPPLTFSKGLEYRKREHILSKSLNIFLARLLSTKNTYSKNPHIKHWTDPKAPKQPTDEKALLPVLRGLSTVCFNWQKGKSKHTKLYAILGKWN